MTHRLMYMEEAPDLPGEPKQRAVFDSLLDGQDHIFRLWLGRYLGGEEMKHFREMHKDACQLVYRVGRGRGKARAWVLIWIEEVTT